MADQDTPFLLVLTENGERKNKEEHFILQLQPLLESSRFHPKLVIQTIESDSKEGRRLLVEKVGETRKLMVALFIEFKGNHV